LKYANTRAKLLVDHDASGDIHLQQYIVRILIRTPNGGLLGYVAQSSFLGKEFSGFVKPTDCYYKGRVKGKNAMWI